MIKYAQSNAVNLLKTYLYITAIAIVIVFVPNSIFYIAVKIAAVPILAWIHYKTNYEYIQNIRDNKIYAGLFCLWLTIIFSFATVVCVSVVFSLRL